MTFEERHEEAVNARAILLMEKLYRSEDGIYRREEAADNLDLAAIAHHVDKGNLWFIEHGGEYGMHARWRLTVVGRERAAKLFGEERR